MIVSHVSCEDFDEYDDDHGDGKDDDWFSQFISEVILHSKIGKL